jgi:RNA ligase (TIGR02306 family)
MMRKLASVVRVDDLRPIPKADAIELAVIAGWQCVVKKGEFAVADRAVYLEIDAVPPDTPTFSWLWQPKTPGPGPVPRPASFRIRTMRLRGCLSQGLLLPLPKVGLDDDAVAVGDDVTARLGVTKYEPDVPLGAGGVRGPFPGVVPKTDEMRVQAVPAVLDELRGHPWVATLKCDGTSATFVRVDDELHCCSRNQSVLDDGKSFYWQIARAFRLDEILAHHPRLAIQGEIVGPGIQKNPMGLTEKSLRVFNVFDIASGTFFGDADLRAFCASEGLVPVPLVESGDAFDETVTSLLLKAEGLYDGTTNEREGIVVRPRDGDRFSEALGGRLSFKAISNRFLLAE